MICVNVRVTLCILRMIVQALFVLWRPRLLIDLQFGLKSLTFFTSFHKLAINGMFPS